MLTVHRAMKDTFLLASNFTSDYGHPRWQNHPYWMSLPAVDVFWGTLKSRDILSEALSCTSLFGKQAASSESTSMFIGFPLTRQFRSLLQQYGGWSQYVTNIAALFKDWNFSKGFPTIVGQNPVLHFNLVGDLGICSSDLILVNDRKVIYDYPIQGAFTYFTPSVVNDAITSIILDRSNVPVDTQCGYGDLLSLLISPSFDISSFDYLYGDDPHCPVSFGNFQMELSTSGSLRSIRYAVQASDTTGSSRWYRAVWYVIVYFAFVHQSPLLVSDEVNDVRDFCTLQSDVFVSDSFLSEYIPDHPPDPLYNMFNVPWVPTTVDELAYCDHALSGMSACYFGADPNGMIIPLSSVTNLTGTTPEGAYVHGELFSLDSFRRMSLSILSDCFPAAAFSTRVAVDTEFQSLKSDYLENLSQLDDLMRIVDIPAFIRLLPRLLKGSKVKVFLNILDILSDAYLTYSFGIAPSVSDAKILARRAAPLAAKFRSPELFGERTMHGKFIFAIPDKFTDEFKGCTMIARSALRYSVNPDSFLSGLLPIRSLGLLPTLSNLWDLVPFSFLVDYALHLGDAQDLVETSAMLLTLNLSYAVQSISILYGFTESDLEKIESSAIPVNEECKPGYTTYCRYATDAFPAIGSTRFNFFGEASIPDWGVIASLAYKFIH